MEEAQLRALAERYRSFYLYDGQMIARRAAQLTGDFPGIQLLYSIKANHHPAVVRCVLSQGLGADAASLSEVRLAADCGLDRRQIYYSAPGKTRADLEEALSSATVIADSLREVRLIEAIAREQDRPAAIGVRLNPDFSFQDDEGRPSKFGIDEEQALAAIPRWNASRHVKITGLHVHLRSQELDGDALARYHEKLFQLAERFQESLGRELTFLNLGSGIGIPYAPQDQAVDTALLGRRTGALLRAFRERFPRTRVLMETGRYPVGPAGVYVTQVVDKKISHGKIYVLLANTLNGFFKPSVAHMVLHYSKEERPAATEPLFTGRDACAIWTMSRDPETRETVTLAGNLCTAADVIEENISLPMLEPGDLVAFSNAGSYAAVLSPVRFSSQFGPAELFLSEDGQLLEN